MSRISQLLEGQCESLIREISVIISEKWPQLNNEGYLHITSVFDTFTELYARPDQLGEEDLMNDSEQGVDSISHTELKSRISNFLVGVGVGVGVGVML